jgi:dTDP-4-amino-4,6-dideoxygalactose transaminase
VVDDRCTRPKFERLRGLCRRLRRGGEFGHRRPALAARRRGLATVITTPLTFCATANTIIHAGATPVFADVDRHTGNISPERHEAALTPRTKAILPVYAGRAADVTSIR